MFVLPAEVGRGRLIALSDLHLSAQHPELTRLFWVFCDSLPADTTQIFILGDLFDYWAHPQQAEESPQREVLETLQGLAQHGIGVWIMTGNRDFALDAPTLARFQLRALPDPTRLPLADGDVLLTHGDLLCTDDVRYQRFRRAIRNPWLLGILRHLPYTTLKWLASRLRQRSRHAVQQKTAEITDASPLGICQAFEGRGPFTGQGPVQTLLHGHTHRPTQVPGPLRNTQRIVLGDWSATGTQIATHTPEGGWQLQAFPARVTKSS